MLACIMRLFQLDLLAPVVLLIDCEDPAAAKERLPRPSASRKNPATASLLSRAFARSVFTATVSISHPLTEILTSLKLQCPRGNCAAISPINPLREVFTNLP